MKSLAIRLQLKAAVRGSQVSAYPALPRTAASQCRCQRDVRQSSPCKAFHQTAKLAIDFPEDRMS